MGRRKKNWIIEGKIILARARIAEGNLEAAGSLYRDVIERTRGVQWLYYAIAVSGLGTVLCGQNQCEEALRCHLEGLSVLEQMESSREVLLYIAEICNDISDTFRRIQDYQTAFQYAGRAEEILKGLKAPEHLGYCYYNFMMLYGETGDDAGWTKYFFLALKYKDCADRNVYGDLEGHIYTGLSAILAESLNRLDKEKSLELARRVLQLQRQAHPGGGRLRRILIFHMNRILLEEEDYDGALKYLEEDLEVCRVRYGEEHTETAMAYLGTADCLGNLDENSPQYEGSGLRALNYAYRALDILKGSQVRDMEKISDAYLCLSSIYFGGKMYGEAMECARKALEAVRTVRGNDDLRVRNVYALYAAVYRAQGDQSKADLYAAVQSGKRSDITQD